jgi:arsenate reductase (glutaredoxin)
MSSTQAWINPNCSKSRGLKALLDERGIEVEYRHYLETPPSVEEIQQLLTCLPDPDPRQIIRSKEVAYQTLGLEKADRVALIEALVSHPILLERPILVVGDRAIVARPPEKALALLDELPPSY